MDAISAALASGDAAALVAHAENLELDMVHTSLDAPASCALYKAHLLGYLLLRDLDAARFLWKRVPPEAKAADAELPRAWAIGKCMWTGDCGGAIRACGAEGGSAWSALLAPAVERLREVLRAHALTLVGKSYVALSGADMAAMLDLPEEEALALAARHGWGVQAAEGGGATVQPSPVAQPEAKRNDLGMGQLAQLTHLAAQLD